MTIRMIAMDMDDTLLDSQKRISARNIQALRRARELGVVLVPASGRPIGGIPKELWEDVGGLRYAIVLNGAAVMDREKNRILYQKAIDTDTSKILYTVCRDLHHPMTVYLDGLGYMSREDMGQMETFAYPAMMPYYRKNRVIVPQEELEEKIRSGACISKISVTRRYGMEADFAKSTAALLNQALSCGNGQAAYMLVDTPDALEITAQGVTKGAALTFLAQKLHLSMEEVMAIGDSHNDLSMIKAAGIGVAMANSSEEIRQKADVVTLSNDEDGVAAAIWKYVL